MSDVSLGMERSAKACPTSKTTAMKSASLWPSRYRKNPHRLPSRLSRWNSAMRVHRLDHRAHAIDAHVLDELARGGRTRRRPVRRGRARLRQAHGDRAAVLAVSTAVDRALSHSVFKTCDMAEG